MTPTSFFQRLLRILASLSFLLVSATAGAGTADLANQPLTTMNNGTVVRANLMFVLDDSGSMDWDYMPDWANSGTDSLFRNNDYNGVYYSAAVTYSPPVYYNADGSLNTTTYPSMTSANTSADDYTYFGVRGVSQRGDFNGRILILVDGHQQQELWSHAAYPEGLGLDAAIIAAMPLNRLTYRVEPALWQKVIDMMHANGELTRPHKAEEYMSEFVKPFIVP